MATIAERWMERGWEQGKKEGEALMVRRLLGRMSIQQAAELLGLPAGQVERLAAMGLEPSQPERENAVDY